MKQPSRKPCLAILTRLEELVSSLETRESSYLVNMQVLGTDLMGWLCLNKILRPKEYQWKANAW